MFCGKNSLTEHNSLQDGFKFSFPSPRVVATQVKRAQSTLLFDPKLKADKFTLFPKASARSGENRID